jgi:signal transduction histidine kinase
MDKNLDHIADFIKASQDVPEPEKPSLLKALKAVDKELQILVFKLDRTEKVKRTTSILLEETIAELEQKRSAVEEALSELKATQKQLIHAEKMASLGELTAGIAHEIQNPLNFVNNFSEVSGELIDEMQEEIEKGAWEEVKALGADLKENLSKINHHGQRADAIVKGMLQHSRSGEGEKELTDLNALADEYLRLAYHGLRAKDKGFNTEIITDFDPSLPRIEVKTQDIGRVLLNLINNAFYAVNEKANASPKQGAGVNYIPTVKVRTSYSFLKKNHQVVVKIVVSDNGSGIPGDIAEKIFQPFFTTKPTGSGTGLGLSMSYDIVTKGHGGELIAKSQEGVGTEFSIELPSSASPG